MSEKSATNPYQNPAGADADKSSADADARPDASEFPDPHLLELLVCPVTKTRLTYDRAKAELISKAAALAYPIRNGVPLMVVEAARRIEED